MSMRTLSAYVWFAFVLSVASCSLWNREGPTPTCAELGFGATNACQDGIIASCSGGQIIHDVCEDRDVCSASFQSPGHYRCVPGGPIVIPDAGTPVVPDGFVSESGTPEGGGPDATTTACEPKTTCLLAATDGSDVQALTLVGTDVVFTDCRSLYKVPLGGGTRTILASEATSGPCASRSSLSVVGGFAYWLRNEASKTRIVRAPISGGAIETVVSSASYLYGMVADTDNVYFAEFDRLLRAPSSGGPATLVATGKFDDSHLRLLVDATNLYFTSGGSFLRVAKAGSGLTPTSTLLNSFSDGKTVVVSATHAYVTSSAEGAIYRVPLSGGPATVLLRGEVGPRYVAMDGTDLYFGATISGDLVLRRVPTLGAEVSAVTVADVRGSDLGFFALTEGYAVFREGPIVTRVPR